MGRVSNDVKNMRKFRAREELKLNLLTVIHKFKSVEEPKYEITNDDVINVLSSMISRRT